MYDVFFDSVFNLLISPCSYYSVAIFCKLGVDGFIGTIVLFVLMLLAQVGGIFLVDKVSLVRS